MHTTILEASVAFVPQTLRVPMRLSSGVITEITEAQASVTVEVEGRRGTGRGSIYLSDVWAWPDPAKTHAQRDAAMRALCTQIADNLKERCGNEAAHPTELGLRLHASLQQETDSPVPTVLARILCGSPFDAALHDAVGIALNRSAFAFYDDPVPLPSADAYFPETGACQAIVANPAPAAEKAVRRLAVREQGRHTGRGCRALDTGTGLSLLQIETDGQGQRGDAARTVQVYRGVQALGAVRPRLSVDSNEGNPDATSVQEYLERLQADAPDVFDKLEYLEQPTSRDILTRPKIGRALQN